ncbi:MAG: cytochrome c biogenesis protein CcsA, partial [Methylobacteriaceae bacterium]|nr:cytochrome c biogenesis protein CcsA [Methylobacteriaceae bacterium]
MVVEFGHFALALALGVALIQCAAPLSGLALRDMRLMALAAPAAILTFLMLVVAWAALTHAFIASDFSVAAVAQNSHSAKALMYRISGVWAGHEGSMLLWVLCLGGYGAALAGAGGTAPTRLRSLAIGVEGLLTAVFSAYILLFSNPFLRVVPPPEDGAGLNPILEDPGLAFHPPLLYLGYVGFSVTFAFAVAALMSNRVDALWARVVRPWTLGAWVFLTLGIGVGSFWAYYELGWGGWWNWDPVENASFMPWLSGLALIHATTVTERRGALKNWTVFLSLLTFSLSVLGTFLVRSGILTSVHAFVADPARGSAILAVLLAVSGGSLALFAWRAPTLTPGASFALVSREGALVLNNLFLAA